MAKKAKVEIDPENDIAEGWEEISQSEHGAGTQSIEAKRGKEGLLQQEADREGEMDWKTQNNLMKDW